jgi:hypothetical protein
MVRNTLVGNKLATVHRVTRPAHNDIIHSVLLNEHCSKPFGVSKIHNTLKHAKGQSSRSSLITFDSRIKLFVVTR